MKTKATFLIILLLSLLNCDEVDKLTEFNVKDNFEKTIKVSVTEISEGETVSISQSVTIDLSSNKEINDNKNLIQSVNIESITFEIQNFVGADSTTLNNVSLAFNNTSIAVADITLKSADDSNTIYAIGTASDYSAIANILKNNTAVTANISGSVSETPVSFDVKINLGVKVVIDVI